ncbi:ABC-type antimicrobial peptide transport system, permease component [Cylindrospermum stagnale PCC 7417]|uniref:ABC-type antimicrobial peptide transport system, permease component n=1 Tax=Cylindrospermum stagnale PCC 7417 TaxID=56107 RepID=K9X3I7_9NOST|nr:ABC transporter permease [Cylindrospermum stagnale]AFZ26606.1 ABC-type antimicrobial peptide transport system, permease component [Cylindrospermum stagnale PCC 7417]
MSLSLQDLVVLTIKSLLSNRLRSALTTLGVFMGVAAVNATFQVSSISRAVITKQLAEREAPQASVYILEAKGRQPKLEDMEFLQKRIKNIQVISAYNYVISEQVVFQDRTSKALILAVSENYLLTSGRKVLKGRFFNPTDFVNYRPVAVIDKFLEEKIFSGKDPIGKLIFTSGRLFMIVGVIETKLNIGEQPQGSLLMPISTYSSMTGSQSIDAISMRPYKLKNLKNLEKQATQLLKQRLAGSDIFGANNVEDIIQQQETLELATRGLIAVAMISLLIAGVGIANITIAAVIERTAEIGLRRAIGATKLEILQQFILEAVVLSLVGGIAAIISVHGLTLVIADTFSLPYRFESQTAMLSLGSALLVGMGACLLPAIRASQLDPVKALRES